MYISVLETPLGRMELHTDDRSVLYFLPAEEGAPLSPPEDSMGVEASRQFAQYFAGTRTEFTVPADPPGTLFQRKVWRALEGIPFGETRTYGEIAEAVGCPGGGACGGRCRRCKPGFDPDSMPPDRCPRRNRRVFGGIVA